jgi:streptogramin lyase
VRRLTDQRKINSMWLAQLLRSRRPIVAGSAAAVLVFVLTGCGDSSTSAITAAAPQSTTYSGPALSGRVLVGALPLVGASVQLYAAGNGTNASTPLLTPAVVTDDSGNLSIAAGYLCPAAGSEVYLIARGGRPGAAAASTNSAITFMATLGPCNRLPATIVVNEVTTAAATFALSQFLTAGGVITSSSTNTSGLANAFDTAAALADLSTGLSPGPSFATNGSSPAALINTLANVLNACATSSTGTGCSTLFSATARAGSVAPNNTLDAALSIVRNPASNVSALYALATATPAYTPSSPSAPPDFTLYIDYSGGGMNQPSGLGIDSAGNVWVANYGNVASLFSPLGKPVFSNGISGFGLSASYGLAVDALNNAWIPNEPSSGIAGNTVSVLNMSGQSVAGQQGFTSGGLNYPIAVAIDSDGSAWVIDYGNSHLTHLSSTGQALSGIGGYASPQIAFPVAAAVDSSHNVWIANQSNGTITRVSRDGLQFASFACCDSPSNLAIDSAGNVWVANFYSDTISEVDPSGLILSTGYSGGGLNHPQGIAIDGSGNVWVANYRGSSLTELAGSASSSLRPGTALSPALGLGPHAGIREAYAIAIDASGNVWISNFGSNTITEFIGLAAPVRTPLIGPPIAP